MNQSQGGNPFGRLVEFARPHKTSYIVSVVLAVLGVAFGIVPYFATARMTIELLSGNRDLSFYMVWCLISGGCFVLKAILMGISTRASHEATFEVAVRGKAENCFKTYQSAYGLYSQYSVRAAKKWHGGTN